jgi:hypothetical protein
MSDNDTDAKGRATTKRRFPPPWQVEQTPGGFKVLDARPARASSDARQSSNSTRK